MCRGDALCLTHVTSGVTVCRGVPCAPPSGKITKSPFSASAPLVLPCPPPPVIAHATHSAELGANFTSGMSVSYSCQPGFSLLGDPSVSCTASGNWSLPYPRCAGGDRCCRGSPCPRGRPSVPPVLAGSWSCQTCHPAAPAWGRGDGMSRDTPGSQRDSSTRTMLCSFWWHWE